MPKGVEFSKKMREYLEEREGAILKKWKDVFWGSVSEEAKRFLSKEVDRFQNPFGYRVDESFEGLLRVLFGDFDWEVVNYHLDRLMQMRAVQEDTPSKALNFFLQLKGIIRDELGENIIRKFGIEEFLKLEDRLNAIMLKAFDFFMKYRERLYEVRYVEWKRNNFLLLKKAGIVYDPMEGMPKSKPEGSKNYQ